jgi:hypothetical protein
MPGPLEFHAHTGVVEDLAVIYDVNGTIRVRHWLLPGGNRAAMMDYIRHPRKDICRIGNAPTVTRVYETGYATHLSALSRNSSHVAVNPALVMQKHAG